MIHPFYGSDGRRATLQEVQEHIRGRLGSEPVYGLSEVVELGDALMGGDRISGFLERHRFGEWLLRVSATRGLSWKTEIVPATSQQVVSFFFGAGFGNGSPLPQPSGQWDVYVNDRFALSMRVVNHSQVWEQGECSLAFAANRFECAPPYAGLTLSTLIHDEAFATFGPAILTVPAAWLQPGFPAAIRVEPKGEYPSTRWFQLDESPAILMQGDIYRALDLLTSGRHPRSGDYPVYFGDIHTHSGQVLEECEDHGCGRGTRESNYRYALGPGGLDFYALTDHEWQVAPTPDAIAEYLGLADEHNVDGRFVCLPAFEHTNLLYGHRNVYFRGSGGTVINTNRDWGRPTLEPDKCITPDDLWAGLVANGVPFLTVPHHPSAASHPCTWDRYSAQHDRLVEVYSVWGSSEYLGDFPRGVTDRLRLSHLQDAVRRGLRFGLIASADGHDGHPGNAQSPQVKHHHQYHFCGSGRAAVLAHELSQESVFDALYAKRCYATTGVPIVLDTRLNGARMGEEIPALGMGQRPQLVVRCQGSNGIDHIRVVKNGHVVHTAPCHGQPQFDLEWEDAAYRPEQESSYYVRVVQMDRESAWSSPIWVG